MVPTVAAIVAVVAFIAAGNWQRGRMEEKDALRERYEASTRSSAVLLPAGSAEWRDWRYRLVRVEGRYDAGRQILLDNRVHRGRIGYDVVTPLLMDDGRAVLVDRGWIAAGATRRDLPRAPPPADRVRVEGRLMLPAVGLRLGNDAPGPVWLHVDPERYAAATGLDVLPIVIEQTSDSVPPDGLERDWTAPDLGSDRNRIYMVQWYLFAALVAGFWSWFIARPRLIRWTAPR